MEDGIWSVHRDRTTSWRYSANKYLGGVNLTSLLKCVLSYTNEIYPKIDFFSRWAIGIWCPWCSADRFWCPHTDRVKKKSQHHWLIFFTLKKELNAVFTFAIDETLFLLISEISCEPTAAFYELSMYRWFKGCCSTISRYRFALKPGALAKIISTKTRVELVDLPKEHSKLSLFSAPRQLMSVVEGHEVIVNYI